MILTEKTLLRLARAILRLVGREGHSRTMDSKIKLLCLTDKDELILARWSEPDDSIVIKTYDKSVSGWSEMAVAQDIVENVRDRGFIVEVAWDA